MKDFVCLALVATLAALASAKPQGYNYPGPSSVGPSYNAPSSGGDSSYYQTPQTAPQTATQTVTKHVYVHVAPPEPETQRPPQVIPAGVAQKHYKIVFIKAPTYNPPPPPIIPPQAQNEEKTLVYVLVKKPEEAAEISIPTPAPTQPSKPEVYFIRYKTQKEQGAAPQQSYGAPSHQAQSAPAPQQSYGAPSQPAPAPSSNYGAPSY